MLTTRRPLLISATATALSCAALAAGASAAGDATVSGGNYPSRVTVAYIGGGIYTGTVSTPSKAVLKGQKVKKRCRSGRQVDFDPAGSSDPHVLVRTGAGGGWTVTVPNAHSGKVKIFVTAKDLPEHKHCTSVLLQADFQISG